MGVIDDHIARSNREQLKKHDTQLDNITVAYDKVNLPLTQAEYDALATKDPTTLYLIKEA